MPHVLVMSFEYFRYKRDAVIRIYADDYLVDELCLTKDIKLKVIDLTKTSFSEGDGYQENMTPVIILPERLFLYEIDDRFLRRKIRIEVDNNNNNATNGFMTQFSHVKFHKLFLIPRCLMEEENWKLLDRFRCPIDMENNWPNIPSFDKFRVRSTTNEWKGKAFFMNPRGGNFTVEIPLFKKHKIVHLGKPFPGKIYLIRTCARILHAFNTLNKST